MRLIRLQEKNVLYVGKLELHLVKDLTANKMFKKNIVIFYIATIIFILDRLSKYYILVLARSVEKLDITITTFLNFNLVFNSGIAFGLLSVDETFYYNIITLIIIVITLIILIIAIKTSGIEKYYSKYRHLGAH